MSVNTAALGLIGTATTMLSRRATRNALHRPDGSPRLPRAARSSHRLEVFLLLAAATGVMLAVADVLQEERRNKAARSDVALP